MRRPLAVAVLVFVLAMTACAQAQGDDATEWLDTPEQKVAGLATIWAQAKYGFPSFGAVPDLDWDAAFEEFIPRVIATDGMDEYYWTLMEFAGLLRDGHTSALPPWQYLRPDYSNPPLEVEIVGGAFVVVRAAETPELVEAGITVGTEILEIEGMDARTYMDDAVNLYYPRGSAVGDDAVNTVYVLRGPTGTQVALKVRDAAGEERDVLLTRDWMVPGEGPFFPRILLSLMANQPMEAEELPGGILHITLHNFDHTEMGDEFLRIVDILDDSITGILFDMRFCMGGDGRISEKMISALIDEPVSSPHWKYPVYSAAKENWGHDREWQSSHHIIEPREGKRFLGPVVVLTSAVTSSTAEDFPISLREAGRATLVGDRTSGSAGNPVSVPLPDGGSFRMATFRAYLPDGSEYVGTGVQPDILVRPTIDDIRSGTDPVLEAGLEALR